MPWSPDQYNKFRAERAKPFFDLVGLLDVRPALRTVDLGCGTGELTRILADRLPGSDVLGLDASPDMLARSAAFERPGLRFQQGDIRELNGTYDLIFSNAALQWLADHPTLLARLWTHLQPGGQIAVQVPSNFDHPSHTLLIETAHEYEDALHGFTRNGTVPAGKQTPVLGIAEYGELLFTLGGSNITAFEKIYPVVLDSADEVLEWTSGTALVPYLERLPEGTKEEFREAYRAKLRAHWPTGPVFYAFKRTLFVATKPN